jgi:tRNA A58 N-methylase Trm61
MPDPRRVWKADEIVKLKAMAGKAPGERIAAELGRTLAAVQTEASKLGLSLRTKRRSRSTQTADGASAGSVP